MPRYDLATYAGHGVALCLALGVIWGPPLLGVRPVRRGSRIAIIAGGLLVSVPAALFCCAWRLDGGFYDGPDGWLRVAGLALFGLLALLAWVGVVVRLRRLRPPRVSKPASPPVLPKPPSRPLLPRRPDAAQIAAARRLRIAGRV